MSMSSKSVARQVEDLYGHRLGLFGRTSRRKRQPATVCYEMIDHF